MLSQTQQKTFNAFYNSARRNETLDPKATLLIHMAAAMAVGCRP